MHNSPKAGQSTSASDVSCRHFDTDRVTAAMKFGPAVLLVFAALVALCSAQTFQYSRGWTNGKRAVGVMDFDGKVSNALQIILF